MPTADDSGNDRVGSGPVSGGHQASAGASESRDAVPDVVAALVALRAVGRMRQPAEIRITGLLSRTRGGIARPDRQRLAAAVTGGGQAFIDGRMVTEPVGSRRWLAWFPRPTGPHHAVNVPSPAVAVLARHVPGVRLVRCHLAARAWQAEGFQAMTNVAGTELGRRWLRRWAAGGDDEPDPEARWATVVEVMGDHDRRDAEAGSRLLVRGWAHGTRRVDTGAAVSSHLVDGWPAGPDQAGAVLDALAMTDGLDLRWSVGTPTTITR